MADLGAMIRRSERELAKMRRQYKAQKERERGPRTVKHAPLREQTDKAEAYMAWQHDENLSCICCLIEGKPKLPPGAIDRMEVAHQKLNDASAKGWKGSAIGPKAPGWQSVPLCWWHHQGAPNACDKGRVAFWERIDVDCIAFCRALYSAFVNQEPGEPVIRAFAREAAKGRAT